MKKEQNIFLFPTSVEGILTSGTRLYHASSQQPISREYTRIDDFQLYQNEQGKTFELAEASQTVVEDSEETTLIFYLNNEGKIASDVYSTTFNIIRELYRDENFDNLLAAEKERLKKRKKQREENLENILSYSLK